MTKKTRQRGRKRRFEACPVCGADGLRQRGQRKAGHCVNVYCECPACGVKLRYVSAGEGGHWYKVRDLRPESAGSLNKIG